ncbi:TIGR03067 domain-containing protein [Lichenicoccus roseus]|uniref:TIGR03067 domain-containing protein n=1 Tax=Lichenicoccus roseus TaxID=2683649 RepID=A0A5R9JA89_9PROT|nr:TIGR03067 domain-containing protein [Lichenicoccus roseus]TLU73723.1 TIGR03067 domain-containing protein [Lichenicoccus roseus]
MQPHDTDLADLQGNWEQVDLQVDGVPNPADCFTADGALTTISADRFTVRTADGVVLLEGRFILDASKVPKSITWIDAIGADAGRPLPASYVLEADRFVFIAADACAPRPTVFQTVRGQVMRTFIRRR